MTDIQYTKVDNRLFIEPGRIPLGYGSTFVNVHQSSLELVYEPTHASCLSPILTNTSLNMVTSKGGERVCNSCQNLFFCAFSAQPVEPGQTLKFIPTTNDISFDFERFEKEATFVSSDVVGTDPNRMSWPKQEQLPNVS